jgi:hypothetical protein
MDGIQRSRQSRAAICHRFPAIRIVGGGVKHWCSYGDPFEVFRHPNWDQPYWQPRRTGGMRVPASTEPWVRSVPVSEDAAKDESPYCGG